MSAAVDVLIVGSGPAGVSAAFPLLEAGLRVHMVDGGMTGTVPPPQGAFLDLRARDARQWEWMVGAGFHPLTNADAVSPKLRAPTLAHVFDAFAPANRIRAQEFVALGSLASGGLSEAWGCGVACLAATELAGWPVAPADMAASYARVAQRMGLSGANDDALAGYFGVDAWAGPPLPMDRLQQALWRRYRSGTRPPAAGFRLGRSRVAALSQARGERAACDLSGNCLWGCARQALYSARHDLALLSRHPRFSHQPGLLVTGLARDGQGSSIGVDAISPEGHSRLYARRVVLAAGTLATTRLALQALDLRQPRVMQSSPTAAFLLWHPASLGRPREPAFGLGQLSFALDLEPGVAGFGSLFNPTGIPLWEFARYLPLRRPLALEVLSVLLGSCAVGNLFLPGPLTQAQVCLADDDGLLVSGHHHERVPGLMARARRMLRPAFARLGAWMLPGSFRTGLPGSDIHYAATLPMRAQPRRGDTGTDGALCGLAGVHVVDGACLPALTEKSHTLTIMANADRIGRQVAGQLAAAQ